MVDWLVLLNFDIRICGVANSTQLRTKTGVTTHILSIWLRRSASTACTIFALIFHMRNDENSVDMLLFAIRFKCVYNRHIGNSLLNKSFCIGNTIGYISMCAKQNWWWQFCSIQSLLGCAYKLIAFDDHFCES